MKMFIKTVCITLCISVTALFFSSYKRVEAVAVTTASVAVVAIGSIIVAVATYFVIDNIPDIQSYVKSPSFGSSITTDEEGKAIFNPSSGLPATVNPNIFNALSEESVKAHNKYLYLHTSSSGGDHGGGGKHRIPPSAFEAAVTAAISGIIASEVLSDSSSEGNPGSIPSGSASGIIMGITNANGKPQKVTTVYSPEVIEAFDQFDISYTIVPSITDVHLYHRTGGLDMNVNINKKYGFFIVSGGKLYLLGNGSQHQCSLLEYFWNSNWGAFQMYVSFIGGTSNQSPYLPFNYVQEFKICDVDSRLCFALYQYQINGSKNQASELQYIYGNPEPTLYPSLFERPVFSVSPYCTSTLTNYQINNINFFNILDNDEILSETDVLSGNYECCGYIDGVSSDFNISGNLNSAALVIGQQSTAVSGGENTIYSELSDIEKAIYALAQQQGITYEEMLEQCNILINENGEMYLESLDGVTQSIDGLIAEFEKLVEQGEITIDQGTETIAQLKAILAYLQSLNIEGVNEYISQIQDTLNDLNASEQDRAAVLGEVLGQIQGLNDYLDSLGLKDTVKDISDIQTKTEAISDILEEIKQGQDEDKRKAQTLAGGILVPIPTDFKLYNQCKLLLDNLFNYDDIVIPPDFAFFWDSNNDGISERYVVLDLSFLETKLTNENLADKSWFIDEIKVIDFIRYLIALCLYGLFVMRLIKRLPTFYGSGIFSRIKG